MKTNIIFVLIMILLISTGFIMKGKQPSCQKIDNEKFFSDNKSTMFTEVNKSKFAAIKALNLPIGKYAITGSGALGIRNLRAIGDIDIIVTSELWNILEKEYGVTDENNVKKIVFPDGVVEALGEHSFYTEKKDENAPTINDRIANAEMIEGLPFESLEHVLYYKRKMGREKDKRDIELIEALMNTKQNHFIIRNLRIEDLNKLVTIFTFPWSNFEATLKLWEQWFKEQQEGIRTVCVLERDNQFLGYGSLLRMSQYHFFREKNIPEINAIWIDESFRKQGLGKHLIEHLESIASKEGYKTIGIGVGLYKDYGPAQKLYFKMGYQPDGNGITYKDQWVIPGEQHPVDDDLLIWLSKSLA